MSITNELRAGGIYGFPSDRRVFTEEELAAIADRIDAAHKEAYDAAYQDGENAILAVFDKRGNADVDKTMAEHGWYRALDADKKPIHLGDKVYQVKGGWVYTVKSISFYPDNTTVTFECEHGFGNDSAHNLRHYHAPTVEDVLRIKLDHIADRIDAAHEEALVSSYFDGVFSDGELAENGFMRLPRSIEDKPINEHDKVDWRDHAGTWHENATVVAVCNDGCYVMDCIVFHVHKSDIRHHHAPTVEDVLQKLLEQAVGYSDAHTTVALNTIAEYAKRLTLAGDAE